MPPSSEQECRKTLEQIASYVGVYPVEAYEFVQNGLGYTVQKIHGSGAATGKSRHVCGQQLCEGLREYAQQRWGLLARTVLRRWNITSTFDFGRIVFNLVEQNVMTTSEDDSVEDFRNVYDFKIALESRYRIEMDV